MVQSAVHVTTRLIWPELTRSTTFVSKIRWLNRIRHDSVAVKTSNASRIFYMGRFIFIYFYFIFYTFIFP